MGIFLGLAAALGWGIADFLARFSTRQIGTYRTLFFMQIIGFVSLSAYMGAATGWESPAATTWVPWAWGLGVALLNAASTLALYRSFEVGTLSVVAPVAASYPAVTVLLAILSGERVTLARGCGVLVILGGVILAVTSFNRESAAANPSGARHHSGHLVRGVPWAVLACLGFGVLFWLLAVRVVPALGGETSVWVIRLGTIATLALFALPARQGLRVPQGQSLWLVAGIGLLDTAGFVANNRGLRTEQISVVAVLASLFGAVTVLLAWIVLRERLQRSQWLGISAIFLGILLVSL